MNLKSWKTRILIGLVIVAFAFFQKWSKTETNPYTGKKQAIALSVDQEIAIGLQSAPEMAQQHGGLHHDAQLRNYVKQVGNKLVNNSLAKETPYEYDFHLLADTQTIN